jgi:hypothetical protein
MIGAFKTSLKKDCRYIFRQLFPSVCPIFSETIKVATAGVMVTFFGKSSTIVDGCGRKKETEFVIFFFCPDDDRVITFTVREETQIRP